MEIGTIAVVSPGDMGHAVGGALVRHGVEVITTLERRSEASRARAERVGITDAGSLDAMVARADLVLSILPPASSQGFAEAFAAACERTSCVPAFADMNAVAPSTAQRTAEIVTAAGAIFIDGGIIGPPPSPERAPRFYVSGKDAHLMQVCDWKDIVVRDLGPEIGRASAMKMAYAALTKGTMTLMAAVLMAGENMGLYDELVAELQQSQADTFKRMEFLVPFIAADSGRWIGEMEEIAKSFAEAGVTPSIHEGAAAIFRAIAATPYAQETRETLDPNRTLHQSVEAYAAESRRQSDTAQ